MFDSSSDPIVNIPIVVPFDEADRVDHDALSRNVERWMKTPATGFLVGSQTGEEWFLSEDEKLAVARTVGQTLGEKQVLLGGIDCPSVTETLRRAEAFAEAGAEMVRIRFPRGESTVESYFKQVLARCPVPVLLMHQPEPVSFGLAGRPAASPEVLAAIANMDNVFGYVTDHDLRFEVRVRDLVASEKRFWICNGSIILQGTLIGCNGTTTAFSNIWPEALCTLLKLGMEGRYEEAQPLQQHIRRIDAIMLPWLAAGVKASLKLLGFEGMVPRNPVAPMPPAEVAKLKVAMRDAGLIHE
ncbi:MAG: dihydrodipicolinate synthase family protein [Planctomycetota bacterium]|nr:dihydrodipicolinate synthase family protein [Planctomycetota bacterium]